MTQLELARQWAATPVGYRKASALFCDFAVIYSYTRKFPLAQIMDLEHAVVTNAHCPSQTTKRHLKMVRGVLERARYIVTEGPLT
jgi:hypothetical protein